MSVLAAGCVLLAVGVYRLLQGPDSDSAVAPYPYPCLPMEGTAQHIHPYLRVILNGAAVTIPANVGIRNDANGLCFEPLHTHDASGIIHIETVNPVQRFTLGDFFAIWRATDAVVVSGGAPLPVEYTFGEVLGRVADAAHEIRLLVDGRPSTAGPTLVLNGLDYCSVSSTTAPCFPTAVADPYPPLLVQRYGTNHTIILQYLPRSDP